MLVSTAVTNLRNRRARLYKLIDRTRETIAEIEAELSRQGIDVSKPPRRYHPARPVFRTGDIPRACLDVLREAEGPLKVWEIVARMLRAKGLHPADAATMEAAVRQLRPVLRKYRKRGVVRLLGGERGRMCRWEMV
jgi:hypothetical protein